MPETETQVRPVQRKRAALEYIAILLGAALVLVAISLLVRQPAAAAAVEPSAVAEVVEQNGAHS